MAPPAATPIAADSAAGSASWKAILLADVPLYAAVMIFTGLAVVSNSITGIPGPIQWFNSLNLFVVFTILYATAAALCVLVYTVVVRKRSLRSGVTWRYMATTLLPPRETVRYAVVVVMLSMFMPVFVTFKQAIPAVLPFAWDATFMQWDLWLHFGRHPFEWLQPVLGRPALTKAVDIVYFLWIHVMWTTLIWQAWHGFSRPHIRSRFLLSFVLCWIILGTLMATLLSSAGPVFYAQVVGEPNPYAPLLDYLAATDSTLGLRATMLQEYLWTNYTSGDGAAFAGISAMPSLHVAIAVLMAFLGFSVKRWLGWVYTTFAFLIYVGSIHLAWHYAIDAYVSLGGVALIWMFSGKIVRAWHGRLPPMTRVR